MEIKSDWNSKKSNLELKLGNLEDIFDAFCPIADTFIVDGNLGTVSAPSKNVQQCSNKGGPMKELSAIATR